MANYNTRFAKPPANGKDLHRPLRAGDDLEDAFAWKEERTLSQALTLQYDKVIFILEPSEQAKAAIGKRVTVVDRPDGRLSICFKGVDLPTAPSISCARSTRAQLPTTSGSVPLSPSSASSRSSGRNAQHESTAPSRSARRSSVQARLSLSTSRAR